jgi:antitoxin VapB
MEAEMGLSIKNPKVERLAKELATETGKSMTSAIQNALEEKLQRVRRERDVAEKIRRIDALLESLPPVPAGVTSDHSDLYDENGLPA